MISIEVEGRPAPKGSRISKISKSGHSYTYPASKYEAPWVDAVKKATQVVMRHHTTPAPPYALDLELRIKRPVNRARYEWPSGADLDKLARAVIDGLVSGGALEDDRHVTDLTVHKRYVRENELPGVHAIVTRPAASGQVAA